MTAAVLLDATVMLPAAIMYAQQHAHAACDLKICCCHIPASTMLQTANSFFGTFRYCISQQDVRYSTSLGPLASGEMGQWLQDI